MTSYMTETVLAQQPQNSLFGSFCLPKILDFQRVPGSQGCRLGWSGAAGNRLLHLYDTADQWKTQKNVFKLNILLTCVCSVSQSHVWDQTA